MKKMLLPFLSILLLTACQKDELEIKSLPSNLKVAGTSYSNASSNVQTPNTIQMSGTMTEQALQVALTYNGLTVTATDSWNGSLTGSGHLHIFSSEVIDLNNGIEQNVISKRWLFTSNGNLFFDEVGERNGDLVSVSSIVTGGTGIYKKATGQLTFSGIHTPTGVQFTYSGSITIVN